MKTISVKRRFGNLVSIRDYQLKNLLRNRQGVVIHLVETGETMTIPFKELQERAFQTHETHFVSRWKGAYGLVDFVWRPDD